MFQQEKILKELQAYQHFKQNYKFKMPDIVVTDGYQYCDSCPIKAEDGTFIAECDKWINIGYNIKGSFSKLLSNLFPYEFDFRGFRLHSIEAFFQGIKFTDPLIQQTVFVYSGVNAYHIQSASNYDWRKNGDIYWQGKAVKRDSTEYDLLVDEMYLSAAQNPLYRQALKNVAKPLIHSVGKLLKDETVLTRFEFEKEINSLSAFLKQYD